MTKKHNRLSYISLLSLNYPFILNSSPIIKKLFSKSKSSKISINKVKMLSQDYKDCIKTGPKMIISLIVIKLTKLLLRHHLLNSKYNKSDHILPGFNQTGYNSSNKKSTKNPPINHSNNFRFNICQSINCSLLFTCFPNFNNNTNQKSISKNSNINTKQKYSKMLNK